MAASRARLSSLGEDRFNCRTLSLLMTIALLALQACVIYFTHFNPTLLTPSSLLRDSSAAIDKRDHTMRWIGGNLGNPHDDIKPKFVKQPGIANSTSSHLQFNSTLTTVVSTADHSSLTSSLNAPSRVDTVPAHYYNQSGPTWKKGSFCETFVEHTFQEPVAVCGTKILQEHNIKCYRNAKSRVMLYCILENAFMSGPRKIGSSPELSLLTGEKNCPSLSLSGVHKNTQKSEPNRRLLEKIAEKKRESCSVCQEWINKTAFLYNGDRSIHIYFRMNAYYNLHKAIARERVVPGDFVIIRHRSNSKYLFPEWERKLFPEMIHVDELPNKTICFRKLVLVPSSYWCILFVCKMASNVRGSCFNCKGRGLYGNSLYSFRHRVISSCGLVDEEHHVGNRITIVSRTPYKRWSKDTPQNFQRILGNENDLVKAIRKNFPHTNVTVAHMEALDICTQIGLAHGADVIMGVHGAGLVHLWWLQEDGLAFELNPAFQVSNPTFKMLSTLTGRNYVSVTATGTEHKVTVNVDSVINELKSRTSLS